MKTRWVIRIVVLAAFGYYVSLMFNDGPLILSVHSREDTQRLRMTGFESAFAWNSWRIAGMLDDGNSEDGIIYDIVTKHMNTIPIEWSESECVLDVWERPYRLEVDVRGKSALFYSMGKNGVDEEGGGDDISYQFDLNMRYYEETQEW